MTISKTKYPRHTLEQYIRCPRQYYYRFVLRLDENGATSGYRHFNLCLLKTVQHLVNKVIEGKQLDLNRAVKGFNHYWQEIDTSFFHHEQYQITAAHLLKNAIDHISTLKGLTQQPLWELELDNGVIRLRPHIFCIDEAAATVTVQKLQMGMPTAKKRDDNVLGLYHHLLPILFPAYDHVVEAVYLQTRHTESISMRAKPISTRLNRYIAAIDGIQANQFPPLVNDRFCPSCPFYFICPA